MGSSARSVKTKVLAMIETAPERTAELVDLLVDFAQRMCGADSHELADANELAARVRASKPS